MTQQMEHTITDILKAVVEIAPGEIGKRWDFDKGACIASTAVGLIVCRHFGLASADAICVEMVVGNSAFAEWMDEGSPKFATREEAIASGAQYVMIDPKHKEDGKFAGHLVVGLRDQSAVLDFGLQQFRRPHKQINVPDAGVFVVSEKFWDGEEPCSYTLGGGEEVIIKLRENAPDWTKSPDWNRAHAHNEVAKKIIRKVTRRLNNDTD